MRRAALSRTRGAIAGAVILLVAVALAGALLGLKPVGTFQGTTTTSLTTVSTFSSTVPKTYYVQVGCGSVAICINGFSPKNLTIPAGSMVTWTSIEHPELYVYHRVIFRVGGIDSGPMNGEDVFTATFLSPGVYEYYDGNYPGNNGTITVIPSK